MNIYWNVNIEAEVTQLHERIKFHNVKILALLGPLEMYDSQFHILCSIAIDGCGFVLYLTPRQEAALRYQICGRRLRRGNVDKIRGP
jgi:hypothetical protein